MQDYEEELEPLEVVNLQGIINALAISIGLFVALAAIGLLAAWVVFVR